MELLCALETFFRDLRDEVPLDPGDGLIAAFSGGPDSTALLRGLARLAGTHGWRLTAAHLDHAMDPGSAERARAAARLAERLGVPFVTERREVSRYRQAGDSPEAAGRRMRYEFLEEVRIRTGARWIATAHHRDDQAETVLLRLMFGSGLEGLGGIRPVHGAVVRPLLALPRRDLLATLGDLEPVQDPTNQDLRVPRNRVRHLLLPRLGADDDLLARVAAKARAASSQLERKVSGLLDVQEREGGIAVECAALERLPAEILPFAMAWLHRRAGAPWPAGSPARTELLRQLAHLGEGRAACDCGGGWRWETSGKLLVLRLKPPEEERVADFSYTLEIPGEVEIPEIAVRVGLFRRPVEPWMLSGSPRCAALALPLAEGDRVTVRNRRPGDRIHPLGAAGSRKLKELLIDRRVPRRERDRLPLICVGERIAWVPGVTIDQRYRITGEKTAWLAQIEKIAEVMNMSYPDNVEPLFDADSVRTHVQELGRRIGEEMDGDTLLIALLGGSVIFLADLVRAIERPVRFEFIQVGSGPPGESAAEPGVVEIRYPLPLDLAGQSVLVLKDVVTSGITEPYLEQQLRDHGARDVRFAALIDIPDERKTDFQVGYAAFRTGRQGLLVGYGLKHDGLYGNLPYVARIRGVS